MELGEMIARYRKDAGMTIDELSEELEGKVKSLENNYQDLLERISKLENN